MQVVTQVFPIFDVPNAWVRLIVLVITLGFPVALAFSWVFDLTPEGLVRTDDSPPVDAPSALTARRLTERRLNYVLAALLVLALAYLLAEQLIFSTRAPTTTSQKRDVAAEIPSIAVLAFADMSESGDQGYFADGISEELLNMLAQVPRLHVAGRTSSFSFKGRPTDIKEVGQTLNVATVL